MSHDDDVNTNASNQSKRILETSLKHCSSSSWRDFNIISGKYYKDHKKKHNTDRVYEYRNSMKRLYDTNPYNPVIGKWKQPKRENNILSLEQQDIDRRVQIWNKQKHNNFLHHHIKNIKDNIDSKRNEYDSAKHPEVYHRGESMRNIKPKKRLNPQVYTRSLKRNHHIITNQAWKGTNSIDFPLGKSLKLKHPHF